ncbi:MULTISPECIES: hypothetical protein [unclassified Acinetobacter]|uniref:hypothetical protein n=1 Tax=unclassified Acinetobacter TaxID=196816 RepID=UPI0004D57C9E|nr:MULTISPECIES: hypothetical protein [unclassified Acinetobacter]KEC82509.1 hypothetical protein DT74_02000 [Acinetobacter sp. ETR1]WEE38367.1 hypothetical protein PYV58_15645 [Acinetobacter sp. TAC-1]
MKRLILPWALLQSASICSAKNDPRKYLNGVTLIDGHIVATDAERVFYCKYDELPKLKKPLTIPLKAIKNLEKKLDKTRTDCLVEVVHHTDGLALNVNDVDLEVFTPVESIFPSEWQQMIPVDNGMQYKGASPHFQWKHMVDFQKINKLLGAINPDDTYLKPTGINTPAHVYFYGNDYSGAKGLIMPINGRSEA